MCEERAAHQLTRRQRDEARYGYGVPPMTATEVSLRQASPYMSEFVSGLLYGAKARDPREIGSLGYELGRIIRERSGRY